MYIPWYLLYCPRLYCRSRCQVTALPTCQRDASLFLSIIYYSS